MKKRSKRYKEILKASKRFGTNFNRKEFASTNGRVLERHKKISYINNKMNASFSSGNLEEIRNLINVFDRSVATDEVCECIFNLEALGREQYAKYVDKVIVSKSGSIWDTLHNNKLKLFGHNSNVEANTTKTITALKRNNQLFL